MERHCARQYLIAERLGLDAVEQHHALQSRWSWGAEVELMRRADLVDVSSGVVTFGVHRWWLRQLFRTVPRDGFYPFLGRAIWQMARERPATLPRIFRPT